MTEGVDLHAQSPSSPPAPGPARSESAAPAAESSYPAPDADARPDAELLAAHIAGDADAFAVLVGRHQPRLWAVALRVMRNPDDAADALQDAYIAAFRRAGSYRGDAQVTTWLHRVVVNACLDRLRRMKSRAAEPLPTDLDRSARFGIADTERPLEVAQERSRVATAMATLNPDQRAALVLVDMEGYSVEEAARILGCAVGTVKSRCARGRARLMPLLVERGSDPDEETPAR